jgi:hypothetical protein
LKVLVVQRVRPPHTLLCPATFQVGSGRVLVQSILHMMRSGRDPAHHFECHSSTLCERFIDPVKPPRSHNQEGMALNDSFFQIYGLQILLMDSPVMSWINGFSIAMTSEPVEISLPGQYPLRPGNRLEVRRPRSVTLLTIPDIRP